jgi:hypothetical protein
MRYPSGAALNITAFNFFASTLGYASPPLNLLFEYANYNGRAPYGKTDFSHWDYGSDRYLN